MELYKKLGTIGPFDIISTGNPRGFVGLKDRNNQWVIKPDMGFRSFKDYNDGLITATKPSTDGADWILIDYHGNCLSERYNFIRPADEGYYIVEKGARENIMRRDGSIVLNDWPHRVSNIRDGYFIIGKTIRKTKTTPTQYLSGIAHVCGIIIFPMIFESAEFYNTADSIYIRAIKDNIPYLLYDGAIADIQKRHYPTIQTIDHNQIANQIVDWTISDLELYYRDTDADIDAEKMYPIGKIIRTGFNTSVSINLERPTQKTRFLIASAHAARLCSNKDGSRNETGLYISSKAEEWGHAIISKNAWLKVLDIYKVNGFTQIFLLQIPETAAILFDNDNTLFDYLNTTDKSSLSLIENARRDFNKKLRQSVHPRSIDNEWIAQTSRPIGYTLDRKPYSIEPDFTLEKHTINSGLNSSSNDRYINNIIHKFANDKDIPLYFDGFPWRGIVGSVCDGCMFAKETNNLPYGCGKHKQDDFRKYYTLGKCDYWKQSPDKESYIEEKQRTASEKANEFQTKTSGNYAQTLLSEFIKEHLDGNIENLLKFNFATLSDDPKYSPIHGPAIIANYAIIKSINEIAFKDYWPNLNVETLDTGQYQIGTIINYQRLLGSRITDRHFKSLDTHCPNPIIIDLAEEIHSQTNTLGDFIVWPNKASMATIFNDSIMRGYIDRLFIEMHKIMTEGSSRNDTVINALLKNRKLMQNYQGKNGFIAFMKNSLLDDFIDTEGNPQRIFDGISVAAKDFNPDKLPHAIIQYHRFMKLFIPRRSQKILQILKSKLNFI